MNAEEEAAVIVTNDRTVQMSVLDWKRTQQRIAELEALLCRYHDWHIKNDGEDGGYLESGMYEDACALVPRLAGIGKN